MNKKFICLSLVFAMLISLFPMAALAEGEEKVALTQENLASADDEGAYVPGVKGDEEVAVMVYGKSISKAVHKRGYSFGDFVNSLKAELQGILANEKLPACDLYLVNDEGYEYMLVKDGSRNSSFITSFQYHADGIFGWTEDIVDFLKDILGWFLGKFDTIGQFYRIYGATDIPKGNYTLQVRKIIADGYTLWQPESGQISVTVGDDFVNYIGYDQPLGSYDLTLFGLEIGSVSFSMPGVFYNTVDPGFSFRSADCGDAAMPDTEFILVNRDEVEKIVRASIKMGSETFTNAMNLVGTEGFTWEELSVLDKELLVWDNEAQQITFSKEQTMKLLKTYWALVEASAKQPLTDFLSDETDIRLPAILVATSDASGNIRFTEDCNKTLIWSLKILLEMSDIVLSTAIETGITEGLFENPETEAIVNFVILLAQYAVQQGKELWDENGELVDDFVNDWIYPVLQNDNVPGYAKELVLEFTDEDDLPPKVLEIINMLPTHAILTSKMPSGNYIMFETDVPDGYILSPLFYTINIVWNTESSDIRNWCYVTVGNVGILLPYFAEEYYAYLREFSAAGFADEVISRLMCVENGHLIENVLNDNIDVTVLAIAYSSEIIYNYMGGSLVYDSVDDLAKALSEYLYTYGRTAQNLSVFAAKVMKEAKGTITDTIDDDWTVYNYTTSLRANLALTTQAVIRGVADSIDTSGSSKVSETVKETLNSAADSIDTENHIKEETTEIQNKAETTVKAAAATFGQKLLGTAVKVINWFKGRK